MRNIGKLVPVKFGQVWTSFSSLSAGTPEISLEVFSKMRSVVVEIAIYPLSPSKLAQFFGVSPKTISRWAKGFGLLNGQKIGDRVQLERFIRCAMFCALGSGGGRGNQCNAITYSAIEENFATDGEVDFKSLDGYLGANYGIRGIEKNVRTIFEAIGESTVSGDGDSQESVGAVDWVTWTL